MKLWAVAMVRNEADIVEAFVRHNLAFVDGLVILDHRSADATARILRRLKAQGLPLVLLQSVEAAFFQGSEITRIATETFNRTAADFVFALDADEFIRAASREAVEEALASVPPHAHGRLRWYSYVPTAFDRPFGPHSLELRLREERVARYKLVVRRGFVETGHYMVTEGNHWISDLRTGRAAMHEHVAPERLSLAHCPVRSREQLESKVRLGYEALLATGGLNGAMAYHWRDLYEDFRAGVPVPDSRLRVIAANYTVPRPDWLPEDRIDLVQDPVLLCQTPANRG
jgi:hypothetical protein